MSIISLYIIKLEKINYGTLKKFLILTTFKKYIKQPQYVGLWLYSDSKKIISGKFEHWLHIWCSKELLLMS